MVYVTQRSIILFEINLNLDNKYLSSCLLNYIKYLNLIIRK